MSRQRDSHRIPGVLIRTTSHSRQLPGVAEKDEGCDIEYTVQTDIEPIEKATKFAFYPEDETELFGPSNGSAMANSAPFKECHVAIPLEVEFPLYGISEEPKLEFDLECDSKPLQPQDLSPTSPNSVSDASTLSKEDFQHTDDVDGDEEEGCQYDSEGKNYYYTSTWTYTGLEYTSCAQTCCIDYEGRLSVYSMALGALSRCNWGWYPDYNYAPPRPKGSKAALLVLTVVEGDHYYIDDPFELDGTYADSDRRLDELRAKEEAIVCQPQAQQLSRDLIRQTTSEEGLTEAITNAPTRTVEAGNTFSGYSFNASAGVVWADDEDWE